MYWIGIDIGTSGIKTVVMNERQDIVASAHAGLEVRRPHAGWSEQLPEDWWQAVSGTLDELSKAHSNMMTRVRGIGLSGHMHGATLLDEHGDVLRPCILWNDGRSAVECDVLDQRADFRGIGGNLVMPGFTAPKLEWVRRKEPEIFDRIAKVLLPKDYIRYRLTGEFVSEMSDSAGTLWMDVAGRCWSKSLLEATGLTEQQMPRLVEGTEAAGQLKADLASRWGIGSPPVIAGGGGDNAASACGVGAIAPGGGFMSLGTSGVLFVCTDRYAPNTDAAVHAFCHATPNTWHQMGVILSATDALNWLSGISGRSPEDLSTLAATADPNHGVSFLPYLSGERTPHNNADARGSFNGLSHSSDLAVLAHAVLEGVAFAFADNAKALADAGSSPESVLAVGGGARSRFWLQLIADATGLSLDIPEKGDFGAAFGAARLGFCASENAAPADVLTQPTITAQVTPQADRRQAMEDRYNRFKATYPALN